MTSKERFLTMQQIVKRAKMLGLEDRDTITRAMELDAKLPRITKSIRDMLTLSDNTFPSAYRELLDKTGVF